MAHLSWDSVAGDFKSSGARRCSSVERPRFTAEPKWSIYAAIATVPTRANGKFIEAGADFAAAIHGLPKEDLLSQEVRQQRRALVLLMVGSVCYWR